MGGATMVARDVCQVRTAELCDLLEPRSDRRHPLSARAGTPTTSPLIFGFAKLIPLGLAASLPNRCPSFYERRIAEIKQRWEFPELVDRIRRGSRAILDLRDSGRRRGGEHHRIFHPPRRRSPGRGLTRRLRDNLDNEVEEWMWRRLKLLGRAWFRRVQVGVVLERLGSAACRRRARDDPSRERRVDRHPGRTPPAN